MTSTSSIDVPGLGTLTPVPRSPPGEQFWSGAFQYIEEGRKQGSTFYLCVQSDHEPSSEQREFARRVLAEIDQLIDDARRLLKDKLHSDPAFFGLDAEESKPILERGDDAPPFGMPEATFYPSPDWILRFAESSLPTCEPYGVAVAFIDTRPDHIEALSDTEEPD